MQGYVTRFLRIIIVFTQAGHEKQHTEHKIHTNTHTKQMDMKAKTTHSFSNEFLFGRGLHLTDGMLNFPAGLDDIVRLFVDFCYFLMICFRFVVDFI